jgi:hypothetical protein
MNLLLLLALAVPLSCLALLSLLALLGAMALGGVIHVLGTVKVPICANRALHSIVSSARASSVGENIEAHCLGRDH